jgi:dsRNA-specific ribonuclease
VRWLASIVRLCWLALPFRVRASFWPLAGAPAPPSLHASPRAAALRAAASRGDGAAALPALGYGPDGRHPEPLADVPRWRLEALVGRGLSARAADRVRAALTLPAALSLSVPASARSEFERLEYLGDAVLELAARRFAMRAFSRATEHVLCNAARSLVCGRTLLAAASVARLDAHAAANGHAMADGAYLASWAGPGGAALMVDTFESIAGALFCEYGLESAADWVMTKLAPVVGAPLASVDGASPPPPPSPNAPPPPTPSPSSLLGLDHNYKSLLVLAAGADGVSYRGRHVRAREWGGVSSGHPVAAGAASLPAVGGGGRPRDAWVWRAECRVRGEVKGVGSDLHRATAEQAAARAALAAMGVDAEALWLDRVADQL